MTKTVLKIEGLYYTIIREGGFAFYLYSDDNPDDMTRYRTKAQAIRRANELARTRRQAEADSIAADLAAHLDEIRATDARRKAKAARRKAKAAKAHWFDTNDAITAFLVAEGDRPSVSGLAWLRWMRVLALREYRALDKIATRLERTAQRLT